VDGGRWTVNRDRLGARVGMALRRVVGENLVYGIGTAARYILLSYTIGGIDGGED